MDARLQLVLSSASLCGLRLRNCAPIFTAIPIPSSRPSPDGTDDRSAASQLTQNRWQAMGIDCRAGAASRGVSWRRDGEMGGGDRPDVNRAAHPRTTAAVVVRTADRCDRAGAGALSLCSVFAGALVLRAGVARRAGQRFRRSAANHVVSAAMGDVAMSVELSWCNRMALLRQRNRNGATRYACANAALCHRRDWARAF